jgi:RNA polymerase-interacting CarD/CdnL/TRCF family regulator
MHFQVDDVVVHPAYGIGQIVKIEEKRFSEKQPQLYYKVTLLKRIIWIPVEAQATLGLRPVTAKNDLEQYRNLLKSLPTPLTKNHHHRHIELIKRLKQGSFQDICEIVRDLTAWSWRKPLGSTDSAMLKKTRDSLYQEWATAAGVSVTEAIKEVESLLLSTRRAYLG